MNVRYSIYVPPPHYMPMEICLDIDQGLELELSRQFLFPSALTPLTNIPLQNTVH